MSLVSLKILTQIKKLKIQFWIMNSEFSIFPSVFQVCYLGVIIVYWDINVHSVLFRALWEITKHSMSYLYNLHYLTQLRLTKSKWKRIEKSRLREIKKIFFIFRFVWKKESKKYLFWLFALGVAWPAFGHLKVIIFKEKKPEKVILQ